MVGPREKEFFRNSLGIQTRAEAEQFQRSRMLLGDALTGQSKCRNHGEGMIARYPSAPSEQMQALLLIALQVAREAAPGFLNIGPRLVKGQG